MPPPLPPGVGGGTGLPLPPPPMMGAERERSASKFDRSNGGFESGWSSSPRGSANYGRGSFTESTGTEGISTVVPATFNRLVAAELGGEASEEIAKRILGGPAAGGSGRGDPAGRGGTRTRTPHTRSHEG